MPHERSLLRRDLPVRVHNEKHAVDSALPSVPPSGTKLGQFIHIGKIGTGRLPGVPFTFSVRGSGGPLHYENFRD